MTKAYASQSWKTKSQMTLSSSRSPTGISYLCSESEGVKQKELMWEGEERQTIKALCWSNIWLHSHLILFLSGFFCVILESCQSKPLYLSHPATVIADWFLESTLLPGSCCRLLPVTWMTDCRKASQIKPNQTPKLLGASFQLSECSQAMEE